MVKRIGIDVGGTSIKWGLVSEDGKVLATDFIQSRKDEDQNLVADKLVYKIDEFLKQQGAKYIAQTTSELYEHIATITNK